MKSPQRNKQKANGPPGSPAMKKPPQIASVDLKTKKEVWNILGVTEADHNEMIYNAGLRWLDEIPGDRRELVYLFQDSEEFWSWFIKQYHSIDQRFVKEMIAGERYQRPRTEAREYYYHLHKCGYRVIWDNRHKAKSTEKVLVKQLKK